jgi:hypothetical protein
MGMERAARACILGLGKLTKRVDRWPSFEIQRWFLPHCALHRSTVGLTINARRPPAVRGTAGFRVRDIKKSLYLRCGRRLLLVYAAWRVSGTSHFRAFQGSS